MATIDKTSAEVLAALVLEDVRGYASRYPEEYAAFLERKKIKQMKAPPKKRRKSRRKAFI
jgi:hypothetical protein